MNLGRPFEAAREYEKVNGCTKQFQCQQIFWALGMLAVLVLYCVFTVPPMVKWGNAPLVLFMVVTFVLWIIMVYDYIVLTITDPVDQRIKGVKVVGETKYCSRCASDVGIKTYHCVKCTRCTDELDHHSMLVNNCISLKNLTNYLRLNICFTLVIGCISIQSLVIFGFSFSDTSLDNIILNKWIVLAIGICAAFAFPVALVNLIISFYIRFSKKLPKIEYMYRQNGSNHSDVESSDKVESADTIRKTSSVNDDK